MDNSAAILFCNKVRCVWRRVTYRSITCFASFYFRTFVLWKIEVRCILRGKSIRITVINQYFLIPWKFCQGKAVKHNAFSLNKACSMVRLDWAFDSDKKTFRSSCMEHTIYFSVEESTLYTFQLKKGKLASGNWRFSNKLCVKQQSRDDIAVELFSTEKRFHFVRDFAKLLQGGWLL